MSFCLNCGNHKTCDCAGPPPEVAQQPEARLHPCDIWVVEWADAFFASGGQKYIVTDELKKAFNAGASYACREILDVLPRGPLADCCRDEFQFAVEDIDAICGEWLG